SRRDEAGDHAGAIAAAAAAADDDGLDPGAWVYLGNLLERRGDEAGAVTTYRRAVAVDPVSPSLRQVLATALERTGSTNEAFDVIDGGLAIPLRMVDRKYTQLVTLA